MTLPYLCRSFLGVASVYRLADDLLPCMLDVMLQQQNELGFSPPALKASGCGRIIRSQPDFMTPVSIMTWQKS